MTRARDAPSSMRINFGPPPETGSTMSPLETRNAVLADVRRRMQETTGSGRLKGKVAAITGAGPTLGIGTAAARQFAREGVRSLYLLDYNDAFLPSLADELRQTFPNTKVIWLKADAASADSIRSLVDRIIAEEGHLDIFFANAGVSLLPPKGKAHDDEEDKIMAELRSHARTMKETGEAEFMEVMRINALSCFIAVKYASAAMSKLCPEKGKTIPGGSIILTASVAGLRANAGPIPYSASKAAVISIAQSAAYALAGSNIRVSAICPGLIETNMTRGLFALAKKSGSEGKMGVLNPLIRQGIGGEVAAMAVFLASDDSSYVNGQAMVVDGGLSSSHPYIRAKL